MEVPAKLAFSSEYRTRGIRGALGLSDHGFCWEPDMIQMYAREEGFLRVGLEVGEGGSWMEDISNGRDYKSSWGVNRTVMEDEQETDGASFRLKQ